jgi:hypothetical protein
MQQSRSIGAVLMAASGVQMLLLTAGVMRRSYLALALPVVTAVAVISALMFWVGYTISKIEPGYTDIDLEDEVPYEEVAS